MEELIVKLLDFVRREVDPRAERQEDEPNAILCTGPDGDYYAVKVESF